MKPYGLRQLGAWFARHDSDNDDWRPRAKERRVVQHEIDEGLETYEEFCAEEHAASQGDRCET